jgi:hypothetical protein
VWWFVAKNHTISFNPFVVLKIFGFVNLTFDCGAFVNFKPVANCY